MYIWLKDSDGVALAVENIHAYLEWVYTFDNRLPHPNSLILNQMESAKAILDDKEIRNWQRNHPGTALRMLESLVNIPYNTVQQF